MTVTRFAPSPSGNMHIGNLRTALYAYLYAKQNNGKFILRIEDTDVKRSSQQSIDTIKKTLLTFGLNWDEYAVQSDRLPIYQYYAHKLVQNGSAYVCQCKTETDNCTCHLNRKKPVKNLYCIKLAVKGKGFDTYDIICEDQLRGEIKHNSNDLYDVVLLKSDGYPTYHLASVVDDALMDVTDVFRGDEWLSSFPYHKLIYSGLNFPMPKFYHLPLIGNEQGCKLSKRDGDFSVESLMCDYNIIPSALINYIALLGWHPTGNQEYFTLDTLIKAFDVKRLNVSFARFDLKRLQHMNIYHARTEYGKAEFFERFASKDDLLANRQYQIFKCAGELKSIYDKFKHNDKPELVILTTEDLHRAKLLSDLVLLLFELNIYRYCAWKTISDEHINFMLAGLVSKGYSKKEINEYIRWALTRETKGYPVETLLGLLNYRSLYWIIDIYRGFNETSKTSSNPKNQC